MQDHISAAETDRRSGFLANAAGGIQVLAHCLLAESYHGAYGIPAACWKRCRTHLGHHHEPVVVAQFVVQVDRRSVDSLLSHSKVMRNMFVLAYLVEAKSCWSTIDA